jgi:hypothetical protein
MKNVEKQKLCLCGSKINLDFKDIICKKCSTRYSKTGVMYVSRHNWNIKDYFCSFEKM